MYDAIVVGGGPAGLKTGTLLSKDHDVLVIEEHSSSGSPAQCTGLISERAVELSGIRPTILNRLSRARFHFPSGEYIDVDTGSTKAVLIDRTEFDSLMAEKASDSGCRIRYGTKYLSHELRDGAVDVNLGSETLRSSVIIGADGHTSKVSSSVPGYGKPEYVRGLQYDIRRKSDDQDMIELFFGNCDAPGFFGWSIPFGEYTRIGLCTSWKYGPPMDYLRNMMSKYCLEGEIVRSYCGKIPIGGVRRICSDNLLLVGDAAAQVKAVSGGGVYMALQAAECAAQTVTDALRENDLSSRSMSRYEKMCEKRIGKELKNSRRIYKIYSSMTDSEYDRMFPIMNNNALISDMATVDIDDPGPAVKRMFRHPVFIARMLPVVLRAWMR